MSLTAARRKLHTLETQAWHDLLGSHDAALARLTPDELEHIRQVRRTHRAEVDAIPLQAMQDMPCPAWATPAQWSALQCYTAFYWDEWSKRR